MGEGMPAGEPEKTEEELEALRRENAQQFEDQADARNENRSFVKKIFGTGKVSEVDIAQEEASRINRLVDQKIERDGEITSAQNATEEIARSSEFGRKDEATIKAEEYLKSKSPDILKSIQVGDIESAAKLFERVKDDEELPLQAAFEKMVSNQVDTLVRSGDLEGIKKLVQENRLLYPISLKNIAVMPQEIIQSPNMQTKLATTFENTFYRNREHGVTLANEYVELGLMTKEKASQMLSNLSAKYYPNSSEKKAA